MVLISKKKGEVVGCNFLFAGWWVFDAGGGLQFPFRDSAV
jgi:hypothetical protein